MAKKLMPYSGSCLCQMSRGNQPELGQSYSGNSKIHTHKLTICKQVQQGMLSFSLFQLVAIIQSPAEKPLDEHTST